MVISGRIKKLCGAKIKGLCIVRNVGRQMDEEDAENQLSIYRSGLTGALFRCTS